MNELTTERTMTVSEVAEVLNLDERTIQRTIKKLATRLSGVKNSQGGYLLNELDVTEVKLELEKKFEVKTELEQLRIIAQAQQFMTDMIERLSEQNDEMRPKAEFYDQVTDSTDAIDMGTASKVLNIPGYGRNSLFKELRDQGILQENNMPYQTYIDRGYFRTIEQKFTKPDGSTNINIKTVVYQKGLDYIRKAINEAEQLK